MLALFRQDFAALAFRDPDDAMRLQQVRDWIGGQGWFDVTQYRVNPPLGGPMHWSRIVDLPIAGLILAFRPLFGDGTAEILACATVPLLLLGVLTAALFRAADRIGGRIVALTATLLLLTSPSILVQFTPLRIDHHGWQILMAAVALGGIFDARVQRGGIVAGLALATWLQISSEGLPYAALIAAALALRGVIEAREMRRFAAYAGMLGPAALILLATTRGMDALWTRHCDALSYVYVWPLVGLSAAILSSWRLLGDATPIRRLAVSAIGGGAALGLFLLTGGSCLWGDPFASLGPLAYRYWYLQVMEGRPIWEQGLSMAGVILLPALAGLGGALAAARASHGAERRNWLVLALLLGGATAVSMLVMRAMSVAHLFALPGVAWLSVALFLRAQGSARAVIRIAGSVALAALSPAGLAALWVTVAAKPEAAHIRTSPDCRAAATLAPLEALPPSLLFAPLDMGPDILVRTRHGVIGTAHHRNAAGISAVIDGFMERPDGARGVIAALNGGRGADYVVTCDGLNEMALYAKARPRGLAARLARGDVPGWLGPVPARGPLKIYRVLSGAKVKAAPFMQ